MKNKLNKVSVLIRSFNESKWISRCLKKLDQQTIKPYEIVVVDNNSNDGTLEIIKNAKQRIKYFQYKKEYLPGKMLNYGISKCSGNYILIISAHCIPCDELLIENLLRPFSLNKKICASYARQTSLNFSDDLTIRDLMLTYGVENRLQKTDPQFNNACSMIKKSEWKLTKFDEKITNLEDRYWASKKIKQKKYIFYSSDSQVFHYHGSHHQNDIERLKKTTNTILSKSRNFNLNDKSLNFGKIDIFPIIIHNNISISKLNFNVKKLNNTFKSKSLVITRKKLQQQYKNFSLIKRGNKELKNENLYLSDVLNFYKKTILKKLEDKEYIFICTDEFDKITLKNLNSIVELINNYFPDTIYFANETYEPIFSDNEGKVERINKFNISRKKNKALLIANRNKGIIIHKSNLFRKDKFSGEIRLLKV